MAKTTYYRTTERLTLEVKDTARLDHHSRYGAEISLTPWPGDTRREALQVSIEELRDLRYLIDRAIEHVEGKVP